MLLKGLKVVDFSAYIAGPGAACILGDWGADVIKVERPGGDTMRHVFGDHKSDLGANPIFDLDNRGKRGIVLEEEKAAPVVEEPRGQRQQPKRKDRAGAPRPQGTGQAKPTTRPSTSATIASAYGRGPNIWARRPSPVALASCASFS